MWCCWGLGSVRGRHGNGNSVIQFLLGYPQRSSGRRRGQRGHKLRGEVVGELGSQDGRRGRGWERDHITLNFKLKIFDFVHVTAVTEEMNQ